MAIALGGVEYASISGPTGTINGCVSKRIVGHAPAVVVDSSGFLPERDDRTQLGPGWAAGAVMET